MSYPRRRRNPAGGRGFGDSVAAMGALYGHAHDSTGCRSEPRLPSNWRDRLPDPASYYAQHVAKLSRPNAAGWAQGTCPFHEDRNASLSVQVGDARGGWRCFAGCGSGDLVSFHERLTGKPFKDAVRDLLGVRA